MHNVFHVSLLRPYIEEVPRSLNSSSTEGEHEFVVHKILKHDMIKVSSKKTQLECLIVERVRMSITLGKLWIAHCPEIVAEYKDTQIMTIPTIKRNFMDKTGCKRQREQCCGHNETIFWGLNFSLSYKLA
jgi:hypothetical protein